MAGPAPDAAAPPGMCPIVAVKGGGGAGGGSDGGGNGNKGKSGGNGAGDGKKGKGGNKKANGSADPRKYPDCGTASHPVDVITGRAFTHPLSILSLPGPLPLVWERVYSSEMAEIDVGLGFGWAHSLGWMLEVHRRYVSIWNDQGVETEYELVGPGETRVGQWAWALRRDGDGYVLDTGDGLQRHFAVVGDEKQRYALTAIEDLQGNRISLTYDKGRLVEVRDSAGRTVRVKSTSEGRITAVEVLNAFSQGRWVALGSFEYDGNGNLIKATDADDFSAKYEYDEEHRLTADTDRTGLCFHFRYDDDGRCVESWGDYPGRKDPSLAEGLPRHLHDGKTPIRGVHQCKFEYHDGFTLVTDSTQERRFHGNEHGLLDKSVEGGAVTSATYRDDGHLMSRTDPLGATTVFERDERGRVTKIVDPLERETTAEYDGSGLPVRVIDPAGGVTRVERDKRGNALFVVDAVGGTRSFRYDARGLVLEEMGPTGALTKYDWDAQGNLVAAVQPNGGIWKYTYDAFGRLLSKTDPLGAETHYAYSSRGDLISIRDALGHVTRYAYDGEGHLVQMVDPLGFTTHFTWGGYHRLCSRIDANGHEVRLRYNWEGELVEVYNEHGEVHRLHYDPSGKLIGEMTFDGRELRYRNDLAGRTKRVTNGLREYTEIEYDLAGQLVQRRLSDGTVEGFEYNKRGELITATNSAGEFRFERDGLGRVVREVQSVGRQTHWVEIGFDPAGERIQRKTSLGHTEVVTRGLLGERTRTVLDKQHLVEHQADILGREIARGLPAGGWMQHQYDPLGRMTRRRAGSGNSELSNHRVPTVNVDKAYRYDPRGELVESWDQTRGRAQYAYDPVGQLVAMVPEKARAELFRYDPAGNLYENDPGAAERVYGKGNRLLRKGDTEYRWDDDGRLIEKRRRSSDKEEVWRYEWNAAGLLKEVERPDGVRVGFAYDPFARRVAKRVTRPGRTRFDRIAVSATRFVWDGDVLAHEIKAAVEQNGDPIVEERTYWFEDDGFEPVGHKEKAGWFHYVNDPIGTPERLIAENGDVACELHRTAWGQTEETPGSKASTKIRFQGQYEDAETGLRYNRWRYSAVEALDLFIAPDPLELIAGFHAYGSVTNPFGWIDPLGLATLREAEGLLNKSENRAFPGGSNIGHAKWHVPPVGASDADVAIHASSRGNSKNTTFRSRNQALRALRDCLTRDDAAISTLAPGQTHGATVRLNETVGGVVATRTGPVTTVRQVNVNAVSYRVGRLNTGELHLIHFQPHGS